MTSPSVTFRLLSPAPAALSMVGMRQGMRQAAKIGHRYQINRHSWRRDSGRNNTIFPWGAHNMTTNPFLVHSPPTSTSSKIAAVLARLYVDLRFSPLLPFASLLLLITLSSIRPTHVTFSLLVSLLGFSLLTSAWHVSRHLSLPLHVLRGT